MTVEVSLEAEASAADREAVARVFESADIQADVRADYIRRSADLLPWLIVISVVAARFLWAAVGGAGDEAGRDAWKGLKWLVATLYDARRSSQSPQGGVSISDQEAGVEIQFPPDLPDLAYIRITQIESPSAPLSGILRWDDDAQDWTDFSRASIAASTPAVRRMPRRAAGAARPPELWKAALLCDVHAAAADAEDPQVWA